MFEVENILVNNAAWPFERDYWDRDYLWDDDIDDDDEEEDEEEE